MRRFIFGLAGCLLVGALAGCLDQKALIRGSVPQEEDQLARQFIETVRQGNNAQGLALLDGSLSSAAALRGLNELHQLFNHGPVVTLEPVGFLIGKPPDTNPRQPRFVQLEYQIHFKEAWLVGKILLVGSGASLRVRTAQFSPLPDSLEKINSFGLEGKGWRHYGMLFFMVVVPAFSLTTLLCYFRGETQPKWLWAVFIALPLGSVQLNWTSGALAFHPLFVSLFGTTFQRLSSYAPWMMSVSLPVGATVYWLGRLARRRTPGKTGAAPSA
jgi:hypothetical protein